MALKFVLLVLPALTLANIDVKLSGNFDGYSLHLSANGYGQDDGVITNTERNSFGMDDDTLKNAVGSYFGRIPYYAYLSSRTTEEDLYNKYNWSEVTRTLIPKESKVIKMSIVPITVMQQVFENNSTNPATFDVGISKSTYNTFTSTWSTNKLLSIEHGITYKIDIDGKSGETTYFRYSSVWNQNTRWTQPVKLGATSSMKVTLQPGQSVVADLQANRASIEMHVEYEASLHGKTAVDYYYLYKGKQFHQLEISDCMNSAGISNQLMSREVVDIEFYSESKVVVRTRDMGYKLQKELN